MAWSYVGLLAALVSEIGTRVPGMPFAATVIAGSLMVMILGALVIRTKVSRRVSRLETAFDHLRSQAAASASALSRQQIPR
jgi:hypothetical protein